MENKCYCPVCRKDRNYIIKDKVRIFEDDLKTLSFFYLGVIAVCKTCNEDLKVEEVENKNKLIIDEILKGVVLC